MKKNEYIARIEVGQEIFRFAYSDEPLERTESFSGDSFEAVYFPYFSKFSLGKNSISIESKTSVPSIDVTLYDPSKEFYDVVKDEDLDYEASDVDVLRKLENGYKDFFEGYVTDVSHSGSSTSFKIRATKTQGIESDVFQKFRHDSFQKIVSKFPVDINLRPSWSAHQEIPWKVAVGHHSGSGNYTSPAQSRKHVIYGLSGSDTDIEAGDTSITINIDQEDGLMGKMPPGFNNTFPEWSYNATSGEIEAAGQTQLFDPNGGVIALNWPWSDDHQLVEYDSINDSVSGNVYTLEFVGVSGITNDHRVERNGNFFPIRPAPQGESKKGVDEIWIDTEGMLPLGKDGGRTDDPFLDTGFINIGGRYSGVWGAEHDYPLYRYVLQDGEIYGSKYIRLEIHNEPLNSINHPQWIDHPVTQHPLGPLHLKDDGKMAVKEQVYFADFEWYVKSLEFSVKNFYNGELDGSEINENFRGVRFDLQGEKETSEVVSEGSASFNNDDNFSQINKNIVDNASGKFAVAKNSEIYKNTNKDEYRLRVIFDKPDTLTSEWTPVDSTGEKVAIDDAAKDHFEKTTDEDVKESQPYMNYMTFKPTYGSTDDLLSDSSSQLMDINAAKQYFLNKKYRYFVDPVPREGKDLGKTYPIVYGYVDKVPMRHVMSKYVFSTGKGTAGDDKYVYAAHPCAVETPFDIDVFYDEEDENSQVTNAKNAPEIDTVALYYQAARNPFPHIADKHYTETESGRIRSVKTFENPYHKLVDMEDIDGESVKGIQLRGGEWNPKIGRLDSRYPVRNGFGTSTLYASFGGYESDGELGIPEGSVIKHPLDIIYHYVKTYGSQELAEEIFDKDNINHLKSKIPKYQMSVFLGRPYTFFELTSKICKQTGMYWYYEDGGVRFSLGEDEPVNYSKPIEDWLNIVGPVKKKSEGYKNIYTGIQYLYDRSYIENSDDKYEKSLNLNPTNNEYCARADLAKAQKKSFTVNADWVRYNFMAKDIVQRYVKRLCRRRIVYTLKVKNTDTIERFNLLDHVPFSSEEYGLSKEPVIVTSVKDLDGVQELEVVQFLD